MRGSNEDGLDHVTGIVTSYYATVYLHVALFVCT